MSQWLDYVKFGSGKNGSPAVSGVINTYATCTGTATQLSLTTALSASAGNVILIHQSQGTGAGQWEINYVLADAGATLTLAYPLAYTYGTGAQCVLVPQYTSGTISGAITPTNWNGSVGGIVALMSSGDLTLSGSIDVSGSGFRRSGNAVADSTYIGLQGEGTVGAGGTRSSSANGNGGGGGGKGTGDNHIPGGGGAGGGNASVGTSGSNTVGAVNGTVGTVSGNADLTLTTFGGAGGSGGPSQVFIGVAGYSGGAGGGIVLIFAKSFTLTGTITLGGVTATVPDAGVGAGAGGAGGSCLIKCQTASLGANKITALPGLGATATYSNGGNGSVGRIHTDYFSGITGTSNPTLTSTQVANLKSTVYSSMI